MAPKTRDLKLVVPNCDYSHSDGATISFSRDYQGHMLWVLFHSIFAFAAVKCELGCSFVMCSFSLLFLHALALNAANNSTTDMGLLDLRQSARS